MILAKNILKHCREKGLTLSKLAKLSNVKQPTLHGWTTGRAVKNINDLKRVCVILEVGLHELIFGESDPYRDEKPIYENTIASGVKITITQIKNKE